MKHIEIFEAFNNNLTKEEIESLNFWIDGGHVILRGLINDEKLSSEFKNSKEFKKGEFLYKPFLSTLDKLPRINMTVFRGIRPRMTNDNKWTKEKGTSRAQVEHKSKTF